MRVVVMGVQGSGKSVVGRLLADRIGAEFVDGDDLHPPANKEKMRHGTPLDDADREPWLREVGRMLAGSDDVVVACSALKRRYRDLIRESAPDAVFVHLDGGRELLAGRIGTRVHEFMPAGLLDSQLATLEPLTGDETGIVVDVAPPPEEVAASAARRLEPGERAPARLSD